MPNYTKLFNSIVTSTIWTEDDKTRIVWITMLALADQNGEVHSSIPGLARLSAVPIADVERALEKFLSPDAYSRTPDNEGRRIAKIDGGWELLNHAKYRKMASKEDSKAATAERVRRHRARSVNETGCNAPVTQCNAPVTVERDIAEAETEAEADTKGKELSSADSKKAARSSLVESLWMAAPAKSRNRSSKAEVDSILAKTKSLPNADDLLASLAKWSRCEEWTKDGGQYAPGLHIWIKKRKWESDPAQPEQDLTLEPEEWER